MSFKKQVGAIGFYRGVFSILKVVRAFKKIGDKNIRCVMLIFPRIIDKPEFPELIDVCKRFESYNEPIWTAHVPIAKFRKYFREGNSNLFYGL